MIPKPWVITALAIFVSGGLIAATLEGKAPKTNVDYYDASGNCAEVPGGGMGNPTPFTKCMNISPCKRYEIHTITCEDADGNSQCTPDVVIIPIAAGSCSWGYIPVLSDCTCRM